MVSCCLVSLCVPRLLCPWDFPGKNTRAACHFLPQGIFLDQDLNLRVLHWQTDWGRLDTKCIYCITIIIHQGEIVRKWEKIGSWESDVEKNIEGAPINVRVAEIIKPREEPVGEKEPR